MTFARGIRLGADISCLFIMPQTCLLKQSMPLS
jgi:hypothetical protein